LAHAPVTDLHPEREGVRIPVTPENYKDLAVGHMAEDVRQDGDHVAATALIQDQTMILKIEGGSRSELSCGYVCAIDPTPGVWAPTGENYDVIQRDIVYNHVALGPTDWGRAGATVALRLDSEDGIQVARKDSAVKTEIIDGKEYTIGSAEWADAKNRQLVKVTQERDAATGRADAAEPALKKAQGDLAKATTDLATATDPKKIAAMVASRAKIVTDCARVAKACGVKFDDAAASGMAEGDMIAQAIKLMMPDADIEGKSLDYLFGMFVTLINGMAKDEAAEAPTDAIPDPAAPVPPPGAPVPPPGAPKTDSRPTIFDTRKGGPGTVRQDSGNQADVARAAYVQKGQDAWKQPLASTRGK
jgi:hypothetical protein